MIKGKIIEEINNLLEDKDIKIFNKNIYNLVLCGGGIKGIGIIGSLSVLYENNLLNNLKNISGTSIGALIGFLYLCGYKPIELYDFLYNYDLQKMTSINPINIINNYGLDDGENLIMFIKELLTNKGINHNITFKDLFNKSQIKFYITTCSLNDSEVIYLSVDNNPNMKILDALRMSSSLPFYFTPFKYNNKYYVDGACIDNFPMKLFDDNLENTIGIRIIEDINNEINNFESFIIALFNIINKGINTSSNKYDAYTIKILLPNINITNFSISNEIKKDLYNAGLNDTIKYIYYNK